MINVHIVAIIFSWFWIKLFKICLLWEGDKFCSMHQKFSKYVSQMCGRA